MNSKTQKRVKDILDQAKKRLEEGVTPSIVAHQQLFEVMLLVLDRIDQMEEKLYEN